MGIHAESVLISDGVKGVKTLEEIRAHFIWKIKYNKI
jgi:hypothetical protein